jgi:hypothetical protein
MSRLSTQQLKHLPKDEFGLPASKGYPMPDRRHAANAKARARQQVKKGKLSVRAERRIDAKADRILRK